MAQLCGLGSFSPRARAEHHCHKLNQKRVGFFRIRVIILAILFRVKSNPHGELAWFLNITGILLLCRQALVLLFFQLGHIYKSFTLHWSKSP